MRAIVFLALAMSIVGAPALAQEPATPGEVEAAREMLEASRSHENFVRGLALGIEQGSNELTPRVRQVLHEFMEEHFRYEEMEPEFIRIYTELFTEEELRSFTAFYLSPAGQRMALLTPELQAATSRVATARMEELTPLLMERLMAAMAEDGGQP